MLQLSYLLTVINLKLYFHKIRDKLCSYQIFNELEKQAAIWLTCKLTSSRISAIQLAVRRENAK